MLEDLHERISGVIIECLPYQDFIARYDRPETLFYLDPPGALHPGYTGIAQNPPIKQTHQKHQSPQNLSVSGA
jgi:hypothetical protein